MLTAQPEDALSGVPQEYHKFCNVFSGEKANVLAPHQPYDLKINLEEGMKLFHRLIYSLLPPELTALREFLEENIWNGFICPSKSLWGSPVLFIKKKDGSLCLCIDFRALNRVIEKDHYPLPLIPDLLNSPGPARIYSKIDLKHAYHLVRIAEGDEPKTTFRTRYGSYEWRVMPFGLTNAPAVFQQFINKVLGNLLDICAVGYIDDILIYSDSIDQHRDHVREVLRCLQEAGLYTNPKKCNFHMDTVEYLGFILTPTGLHMDPAKVAAIQNWPEPQNVCDIQSFLGFTNFYHRFIADYSQMTLPLTDLCKKATPWNFGEREMTAFQTLKNAFSTAPVLCHLAPDLRMMVETDVSDHVIAGILSVTTKDNEIRLVAFFSCSLQGVEKNYDTHNKELLAIFEAFKNWQHFLDGSAKVINMVTDHKNLEYFMSSKKLLHHQARWAEFLGQFNMKVQFRPGRLGSKLDVLTCRWDIYTEGDNPEPAPTNVCPVFTIEQLAGTPVLVHAGTMEDPTPSNTLDHNALAESITTAYAEDKLAKKIHKQIKTANQPDGWMEREGCLLFCERKYVPNKGTLCLHTICDHHDHPTAGHFGETKTTELIHHNYHWPGMRCMVGDYVRLCTSCACSKATCHKPYDLLKQLPIPSQPWESISMDFIEQLPASEGFTVILVIVDRLTKQSLFIPTHNTVDAPQLA